MNTSFANELIQHITPIAEQILAIRENNKLDTRYKKDESPITKADLYAHSEINRILTKLTPNIPIISEESKQHENSAQKTFWLVDPIDGTYEFISGTDFFTINIALIEEGKPIFGFIFHPPSMTAYYGGKHLPSKKENTLDNNKKHLASEPLKTKVYEDDKIHLLYSYRQKKYFDAAKQQLQNFGINLTGDIVGSSYKYCLLANGQADIATFLSPTAPWDSAAGQALVEAANGRLICIDKTVEQLNYQSNQLHNCINKPFFVCNTLPAEITSTLCKIWRAINTECNTAR